MPYFTPDDAPKPDPPHSYPHMCETESVAAALARLSATKRRVLRSYVWHVELGSKRVGEWLKMADCPTSPAAWYRQGGKNYPNNDEFNAAKDIYVERALVWQSAAEATAVQQAAHKLRLHSLDAVEGLIKMMADGEKDADKIRAMNSILDRGDILTAVKASQQTRTWQDDVIDLLRKGEVEPDDVIAEFGPEQATELIAAAGLWRGEGGEAEGEGGET